MKHDGFWVLASMFILIDVSLRKNWKPTETLCRPIESRLVLRLLSLTLLLVVVVVFSREVLSDSFVIPWIITHQAPLPWNFQGKNTGVSCHFLLQWILLPRDQTPVFCLGRILTNEPPGKPSPTFITVPQNIKGHSNSYSTSAQE